MTSTPLTNFCHRLNTQEGIDIPYQRVLLDVIAGKIKAHRGGKTCSRWFIDDHDIPQIIEQLRAQGAKNGAAPAAALTGRRHRPPPSRTPPDDAA